MLEQQRKDKFDGFFDLIVKIVEELRFKNAHQFIQTELIFALNDPDIESFGPYADRWFWVLESYAEEFIKSKNVSISFEGKGEEIAEMNFESWCEPDDDQVQRYIDELKAIPIVDKFNKKYCRHKPK